MAGASHGRGGSISAQRAAAVHRGEDLQCAGRTRCPPEHLLGLAPRVLPAPRAGERGRELAAQVGPTSSGRSSPWTSWPAPLAAGSGSSPSSPRPRWRSASSSTFAAEGGQRACNQQGGWAWFTTRW